uniref:Pre-mRNA-processing factor 39 n=2 Tax=Lygus hesperus TaxID=30085 RepID=A0A146LZ25_LYGHE
MSSATEDNVDSDESQTKLDDSNSQQDEDEKSAEITQIDDSSEDEVEEVEDVEESKDQENEVDEEKVEEQEDVIEDNEDQEMANDVEQSPPQAESSREQSPEKESEEPTEVPKEGKASTEPDTEMVSEDEFPAEGVKQLDTEAVSDEELQELPNNELETEAVSDDELPPVKKKRKHRRHSGSEDDHSSSEKKKKRRRRASEEKKSSRRSRSRGKEKKHEKSSKSSSKSRGSRDSSPRRKSPKSSKSQSNAKSKVLPELEKYWKAVRDDPSDFTGWTYLLQYVDQENDVDAAREAYDSFLRIYPYCYGYWRKYADYEKHKGDKSKCEEVFARGLKAIPLSVDLWLHYLNFCKSTMKDNESLLREQFERAIDRCGLEFRSDRLWDFYIKWENDLKNHQNVFAIYDRLLKTPVLGYKTHFENFEDFVRSYQPNRILSVDEFLELRAEAVQKIKEKGISADPSAAPPPGDDPSEEEPSPARVDEETTIMRDKIISIRKRIFKSTAAEVGKRWKFEDGIKRPYFHVKPLEKAQLNSWRDYLDFEISTGDMHRTVILFERCLIACALYEEFWLKYIRYLESSGENDALVRNVYQRACLIHHSKKPYLALEWASFEETKGNIEGARKVLNHIEKQVPNMLLIFIRRINLERRVKNLEGAAKLYEYYLKNNARNKMIYSSLSAKYARFCQLVIHDIEKGIDVLKKAIEKYPDELKLYIALLDLYMVKGKTVHECLAVFNKILERDGIDTDTKIKFAQRKIEFLEDIGDDITAANNAHQEYSALLKQLKEPNKNHSSRDEKSSDDLRKSKGEGHSGSQNHPPSTNSNSPGYSGPGGYNSSYQGSGQGYNSGQYSQSSYNPPSGNQYGPPDQNSSNYQNWNYSQSNYNNSNQSWGGYNYCS